VSNVTMSEEGYYLLPFGPSREKTDCLPPPKTVGGTDAEVQRVKAAPEAETVACRSCSSQPGINTNGDPFPVTREARDGISVHVCLIVVVGLPHTFPGGGVRAEVLPAGVRAVREQPALSFAGLLRQLRTEARLTQEELAEAASLSPRSISDIERGINRTARKDTAVLLADALNLAEPARALFVAAARGRGSAADVLAARGAEALGSLDGDHAGAVA
jgi:transcriptional regulator with XRE-family HTH domain